MHKSQLVSRKKIKVHLLPRNCLATFLFHCSSGVFVHSKSNFKVDIFFYIFSTILIHFLDADAFKLSFFPNFKWQLNLNTPGWLIACIPGAGVIFSQFLLGELWWMQLNAFRVQCSQDPCRVKYKPRNIFTEPLIFPTPDTVSCSNILVWIKIPGLNKM